ncbi:hypothetical protein BU17DRAFT_86285 [Hysterangium stoloniferum]|nr:hypothetical protein BU17DRAFT_86285 [Hysterangium stoloniferum]
MSGTQQSLSWQHSPSQSSINKLLHTTTRGTSLEDEKSQDHEVFKNTFFDIVRTAVQSGAQEFTVEVAATLLVWIAQTAKPPLLPDLERLIYALKYIEANTELFNLLGECLQKRSFSEIRSLRKFLVPHPTHNEVLKPIQNMPKVIPSTNPDRKIRRITPPDHMLGIDAVQQKIDEALKFIHPEIETFLKNPELPKWKPPPFIKDPNILKFLQDLQIPAYPGGSPSLLYHNLHCHDDNAIKKIFGDDKHIFICNTSGSGKTRRILEGLTKYWGFYFVAVQDTNGVGIKDLEDALNGIRSYREWVNDLNPFESQVRYKISDSNIQISRRAIQKVLASRVVVFEAFLRLAIDRDKSLQLKHRYIWLLFQLSNRLPGLASPHPFVQMKDCLIRASDDALEELISRLRTIHSREFPKSRFIIALDEAQHAARLYRYSFVSSSSPEIFQSVLRETVKVFLHSTVKVIVSGTGLSLEEVEDALSSSVGKPSGRFETFVDLGMSDNPLKLDVTLRQYVPLSFLESDSAKYLQQRIREYLPGRYRFLISFVELLLANGLESPHRLLNKYIQQYALCIPGDSLSSEPFIVKEHPLQIEPKLRGFDWEKLRENPESIQEVAAIVQSHLTKGSTPTFGPLTHKHVEYGIARLCENHQNHQGQITEPLAFLSIMKWFETQNDLSLNQHSRGYGLRIIFKFYGTTPVWANQEARIVARLNGNEVPVDILGNLPMNPALGVVHYAETIEEIIGWIDGSPTASAVLVTSHLFGPDMIIRLQDGIFLMGQAKSYLDGNKNELSAATIVSALDSLNPAHWFKQQSQLRRQKLIDTLQRYKILRFIAGYPLPPDLDLEAPSVKTAHSKLGSVVLATFNLDDFRAKFISHGENRNALQPMEHALARKRKIDMIN